MAKIWVFALILLLSLPSFAQKKISLNIYADLSRSMQAHPHNEGDPDRSHLVKLGKLMPSVIELLEKQCGATTVSINNLRFEDRTTQYKVFGEPHFLNRHTDGWLDMVEERLNDPIHLVEKSLGIYQSNKQKFPVGGKEVTYSSISNSLAEDIGFYRDQDLVAAIIFTDAIPNFEDGSPQDEINKIGDLLGHVPFIASSISIFPNTLPDALSRDYGVNTREDYCVPDENGSNGNYQPAYKIHEFVDWFGGEKADICDDSFEREIEMFVRKIVLMAQCKPAV